MKNYCYASTMRLMGLFLMAAVFISMAGCKKKTEGSQLPVVKVEEESVEEGDSTVYGECIDAGMNSLTLLTNSGDTIEYVFVSDEGDADVQGGQFQGDRMAVIGVIGEEENTAQKVINLTSLLGRWVSLDKNFEIKDGGVVESTVTAESNPYTSWKVFNGHLILSKDTFDIVNLDQDSLYLENDKGIFAFKRQM